MFRHKFAIGAATVAFALSTVPALAQEDPPAGRPAGGAERQAGTGERTGTAVPRGESGGAESRGAGNSGAGMSGGGSMGSSSSPSAPSSSGRSSWDAPVRGMDAPARSQERAPRSRGEATGRTAVPRGGTSGDSGGTMRTPSTAAVPSGGSVERTSGPDRRAVPAYSRPRDGRTQVGEAIERRPGTSVPNLFFYPYYSPYYSPYGFWGSGYGFGLNYLYYDPFWFGGYGYPGYGGYGYGGGYGGYGYDPTYYSSSGQYGPRETGGLRLRISPNHAQVFVDGYYVGDVDSFDGVFQRLTIEAGPRRIEIRAEGYETLQFDVLVSPGETVTYRGEMTRIQ